MLRTPSTAGIWTDVAVASLKSSIVRELCYGYSDFAHFQVRDLALVSLSSRTDQPQIEYLAHIPLRPTTTSKSTTTKPTTTTARVTDAASEATDSMTRQRE